MAKRRKENIWRLFSDSEWKIVLEEEPEEEEEEEEEVSDSLYLSRSTEGYSSWCGASLVGTESGLYLWEYLSIAR